MNKALKIEVEAEHFARSIREMQRICNKSIEEAVTEGAKMFARSAARATPPLAGKKLTRWDRTAGTKRDLFNRTITPIVFNVKGHAILPADRQKALIAKNGRSLTGKAKKSNVLGIEFFVMRKIPTTRKFKRLIFDGYEKAKEAAKITTRGLLRAGWWGNAIHLGETIGSIAEQYGERVAALLHSIARADKTTTEGECTITVRNDVNEAGAESAAASAIAYGYGRAGNAMNAIAKKAVDSLEKLPF